MGGAPVKEKRWTSEVVMTREQRASHLVFGGVFAIAASAGIMAYSALDMALNPEANDLHTLEDWSEMVVWAIPVFLSLMVLAVGLLRAEARLMIFAGVLAGFSFLGMFAVVGQLMIWAAHSKFGLPWKADTRMFDDTMLQMPEDQRIAVIHSVRMFVALEAEMYGETLRVDSPLRESAIEESRELRRDLESIGRAVEATSQTHPRKSARRLDRLKEQLDEVRELETALEKERASARARAP